MAINKFTDSQNKLLPPALFLICIIAMVFLRWLLPQLKILSYPINMTGIIPLIIGLALSSSGSKKFNKVGTNIQTFGEPRILIKDGLYKYSRNPMYLGFLLGLSGVALILENLSALVIVIFFYFITNHWYISYEEKAMSKKFGKNYEQYKTQTRRWI